MNCIFCHKISDNSKSIEHIVPESLGNKEHVLWKGAVCDKCNNYFATKIEKELLEQPFFVSMRHRNFIKTKRGHSVPQKVLLSTSNGWKSAIINFNEKEGNSIYFENDEDFASIMSKGKIISPLLLEPEHNNYILSRFLAKCAFEYLLLRMSEHNGLDTDVLDFLTEEQFTPIREYARYGKGCKFWTYYQRRIYGEDVRFIDENENNGQVYEILHELDLLCIEYNRESVGDTILVSAETYFVIVIMGIEYVVNVASPEIEGYELWLKKNNFKSQVERNYEKQIYIPDHNPFSLQITKELIKKIENNNE